MRNAQEFYCNECDGYFIVRINMALDHTVHIKCPNCGHDHRRVVKNGEIFEVGAYGTNVVETIRTTKSTYRKEPITTKMRETAYKRDGVTLMDRWVEKMVDETQEITEQRQEETPKGILEKLGLGIIARPKSKADDGT